MPSCCFHGGGREMLEKRSRSCAPKTPEMLLFDPFSCSRASAGIKLRFGRIHTSFSPATCLGCKSNMRLSWHAQLQGAGGGRGLSAWPSSGPLSSMCTSPSRTCTLAHRSGWLQGSKSARFTTTWHHRAEMLGGKQSERQRAIVGRTLRMGRKEGWEGDAPRRRSRTYSGPGGVVGSAAVRIVALRSGWCFRSKHLTSEGRPARRGS